MTSRRIGARMAQVFAGDALEGRLAVFRTKDAARDWLLGHQLRQRREATIGRHLGTRTNVTLLDLAMPNRTGLDALPELGRVAPTTKIIVFSGFSNASVAEDVIALGAVRCLSKGAGPTAILDAIEEAAATHEVARSANPHNRSQVNR
jgi:DNA-binding NarL/FixJ family response regulator